MNAPHRAAFLDRDGVLARLVIRDGQAVGPRAVSEFVLHDDAVAAVRDLKAMGLRVFVVTNQPDVARGNLTRSELDRMSDVLTRALAPDDMLVCLHDDADACACRKPAPGMLLELAGRWDVDLSRSFMVGDTWRDIEAGRRAGCTTILVRRDAAPACDADASAASLADAVRVISSHL